MAEGVVNTRRVRFSRTAPSVVLSAKKFWSYCALMRDGLVLHGALLKHQEHRRRSASSSLRMIFWRIASSGSSGGKFSISAASYLEAASQVTAGFLFTVALRIL